MMGVDQCGQRRFGKATCGECRFFRKTGENSLTGRVYGECVLLTVRPLFAEDRACKMFEVKK